MSSNKVSNPERDSTIKENGFLNHEKDAFYRETRRWENWGNLSPNERRRRRRRPKAAFSLKRKQGGKGKGGEEEKGDGLT